MIRSRYIPVAAISLFLIGVFSVLNIETAFAQDAKVALQRGFRTGYSDGYMAGYRDSIDNAGKNITRHSDYDKASRAFNREYGLLDDYRDGYRQGFESGYDTGFEKRSFESTIPSALSRRGSLEAIVPLPTAPISRTEPVAAIENIVSSEPAAAQVQESPADVANNDIPVSPEPAATGPFQKTGFVPVSDAVIIIPKDTELILELNEALTTETAREGDKFTAKIISPTEITGALVEGRISKITKPGRIKRRSEIHLTFNRIILNESRWSNFDAVLTEVLPSKGDNVKRVDNEGTAVGDRPHKSDLIKIGASTGTGLTIGAIAGGPVGAAVGAGVGAAFGVGAVLVDRGKHINLAPTQQFRVRTSYETQIR